MPKLLETYINFRVSRREAKLYKKAAKERELAMSVWIRRTLLNEAKPRNNVTNENHTH